MNELSELEASEHWGNHVEEALWIKNAIIESAQS